MINNILSFLLIILIIYSILTLYNNGKKRTIEWAIRNDYKIIDWVFAPFYNYYFLSFGLHPAHFKIKVEDKNRNIKFFSIAVGGRYWFSDKITVREIKKL